MANFRTEFEKGQAGGNKGLPMGEGLGNVSKAINGTQRARIYGIAAPAKAGKSTFTDYAFIISPFLYLLENPGLEIQWIYYSLEIDRVSKEFDFAAYFMVYDYGLQYIQLPDSVTKDGKNVIELSPNYLRGRMQDDNENLIKVNQEVKEKIRRIYLDRIIPLFGEFSPLGIQIRSGLIIFIEQKENPTGIYKYLKSHAEKSGKFIRDPRNSKRIIGYNADNPSKYTIVITDHLRKLIPERGWNKKQTVDKYIEYTVELRNWCSFTFAHIIHLNRAMTDPRRIAASGDMLYPNSDDIKDTGNLSEDADYLFTIFNPNDERYRLNKHFGLKIKDSKGNEFYPNLRTIHLVESRHCDFPQHFRNKMYGANKSFALFNNKSN